MKYYAGIGSRLTPAEILMLMTAIAAALRARGWTLRSGHARGADQAFEAGAGEDAEIYLPGPGFERAVPILGNVHAFPGLQAMKLAERFHPNWDACSPTARKLLARDGYQLLGPDLDDPVKWVKFVVCWTPKGTRDGRERGGTSQALRIAAAYNIPVFNLQRPEDRARVTALLTPA